MYFLMILIIDSNSNFDRDPTGVLESDFLSGV